MTDEQPETTVGGLTVRALPGARFGAEITGLDPLRIGDEQRAAIWDAYARRHGLLCFSFDRLLEADELHALTAVFGKNEFAPGMINGIGKGTPKGEEHLTVEEQVAALRARGEDPYLAFIGNLMPGTLEAKPVDDRFYGEWEWHSDMSYIAVPPTFSLLHGRVIPERGWRHGLLQPGDGGAGAARGAAAASGVALGEARFDLRQQRRDAGGDGGPGDAGGGAGAGAPDPAPRAQHRRGGAVPRPAHERLHRRSAAGGERAAARRACGRTRRRSASATATAGAPGRWSCGTTG